MTTSNRNAYMKDYMRKRRQNDPERVRKVERDYVARLREKVISLLGSRCSNCGCDSKILLELNHINGGGCQERRTIGNKGIYRRALKCTSEYNLLCRVCNALHYVESLGVRRHVVKWKK